MDSAIGTSAAVVPPVPRSVWLMALVVAALRALPFVELLSFPPPAGSAFLPLGYIPKDGLAYAALIRQPADTGRWLLANPFTTEPQAGRFVLLFHQALAAIHASAGIDSFWLLELSRLPVLLLFFALLWRLVARLLPAPPQRLLAMALVAFSGGLEPFFLPLASAHLPTPVADRVAQDLWHLYGWSSFGACYNPLWIAALALLVWMLPPLLQPGGPRGPAERLRVASGLVLLVLTHSYSAILALGIIVGVALVELALDPAALRARWRGWVASLAPALLLWGAVAWWQLRDPVFRASTGGLFGGQAPAFGWYPVTFGLVGFFALRGFQLLDRMANPWRFALGGWLAGVTLLATSTLVNGYHFVFGLHLPLCLAAAPALHESWLRWRQQSGGMLRAALAALLLFASPLDVTARSLREARDESAVPRSFVAVVADLRSLAPTAVLSSPALGNLIPAMTPHRVWVGHWFMTPQFPLRASWYQQLLAHPAEEGGRLRELVDAAQLGAVIVPASVAAAVASQLAPRVLRSTAHGELAVLVLAPAGGVTRAPREAPRSVAAAGNARKR